MAAHGSEACSGWQHCDLSRAKHPTEFLGPAYRVCLLPTIHSLSDTLPGGVCTYKLPMRHSLLHLWYVSLWVRACLSPCPLYGSGSLVCHLYVNRVSVCMSLLWVSSSVGTPQTSLMLRKMKTEICGAMALVSGLRRLGFDHL